MTAIAPEGTKTTFPPAEPVELLRPELEAAKQLQAIYDDAAASLKRNRAAMYEASIKMERDICRMRDAFHAMAALGVKPTIADAGGEA